MFASVRLSSKLWNLIHCMKTSGWFKILFKLKYSRPDQRDIFTVVAWGIQKLPNHLLVFTSCSITGLLENTRIVSPVTSILFDSKLLLTNMCHLTVLSGIVLHLKWPTKIIFKYCQLAALTKVELIRIVTEKQTSRETLTFKLLLFPTGFVTSWAKFAFDGDSFFSTTFTNFLSPRTLCNQRFVTGGRNRGYQTTRARSYKNIFSLNLRCAGIWAFLLSVLCHVTIFNQS